MDRPLLSILVIDDDEDDVVLIGRSLSEVRSTQFRVHWAPTYEEGLSRLCEGGFDACLLDYFLGARNGLELLRESVRRGCEVPTIMLTSRGDYGVDTEALRSGAADYLVKDQITADLLDRAIRYSIRRKGIERDLRSARDQLETRVKERTADLEAAYRALKESEERSRMLVENAFDIIYLISADRKIESFNPAFEIITGWSAAQWVGKDYSHLIHPDDLAISLAGMAKTLRGEPRAPAELRIRSKSGGYRTLECRTVPYVRDGKIVGVIGTAHDVTERKQMEEALRSARDTLESRVGKRTAELATANEALRLEDERLQALWELSQVDTASAESLANFVVDKQVRLTRSKVGWLGFTGEEGGVFTISACSNKAFHACTDLPVRYPLARAGIWTEIIEKAEPIINNGTGSLRTVEVCPNDRQPLSRFMSVPVFENGRVAAVALVGNKEADYDQSDLRQLTLLMDGIWKLIQRDRAIKALRESESHAAMGRALSYVAHDIKTPLIAIGGFTNMVYRRLDPDNPDKEKLAIVLKETARLEMMVKDMLDFSRPLELRKSRENIRDILFETLAVLAPVAEEKRVSLHADSNESIASVPVDITRMKQVFMNLIMNAIQASPPGQTVSIRMGTKDKRFVLDVMDCGCGIPPEKRHEVFSPFFTTKREGTGLGLSIVKRIVEAHNGSVEIIDNSSTGITFRIAIPMDQ